MAGVVHKRERGGSAGGSAAVAAPPSAALQLTPALATGPTGPARAPAPDSSAADSAAESDAHRATVDAGEAGDDSKYHEHDRGKNDDAVDAAAAADDIAAERTEPDAAERTEPDAVVLTKIEIRQALLNELEELGESHPGRSAQELLCLSFDGKDKVPASAFLDTVFKKTGLGGELDPDQRRRLVALLAGFDGRASRNDNAVVVNVSSLYFQLIRELSQRELQEVACELQSWIAEAQDDDDDNDGDDDDADEGGDDGEGEHAGGSRVKGEKSGLPTYLVRVDGEGGFLEKLEELGFDYGLKKNENQRLFEIMRQLAARPAPATTAAAAAAPAAELEPFPSSSARRASASASVQSPGTMSDTTEDEEDEESDADVLADLDAEMQGNDHAARAAQRSPQNHASYSPSSPGVGAAAVPASPARSPKPPVPLDNLTILQTYMLLRAHEDVRGTATGFRDLQFDGRMLSEITAEDIDEIAEINDSTVDAAARISHPLRAAKARLVEHVLEWRHRGVDPACVHFSVSNEWAVKETSSDMDIVVDPVHRDMMKTLENMLQDIDDLYYFRDSIENVMRSIALNNFTQAESERGLLASQRNSFKAVPLPKPSI